MTLLLPKLHLKTETGLITQGSDTDDDSGNETKNLENSVIDKVAAAQKLFATPEKPSSPNNTRSSSEQGSTKVVGFWTPSSPTTGRRSGVVSAPRTSVVMNPDERSKNVKNLMDSKRKLSSEPGLISTFREDGEQTRKASSSDQPRKLRKQTVADERERSNSKLPLPTVEEETNPSSVIIQHCRKL